MKSNKFLFISVFVLIYTSKVFSSIDSFSFNQTDKLLHISSSYAFTFTTTKFLEKKLPKWKSLLYAGIATMVIGTTKELMIDDHYSEGDQLGNIIGLAGATVVIISFDL